MSLAHTQPIAHGAWSTPYAFEPTNGGRGVALACTGSSARVALPTGGEGNALCVTNKNADTVYVLFGNSAITATTAEGFEILPGTKEVINIPEKENWTHVAGITDGSSMTIKIHRGFGV